jgi:hypothetical protein
MDISEVYENDGEHLDSEKVKKWGIYILFETR